LNHPRFFAFIPSPSNFVSVMADALVSGFNVFAGTWLEAPAAIEVEMVTIDWLRRIFNFPDTTKGIFVSGGSVANLIALAVARHVKLKDEIENAVIYFSDQTHSSIERGLRILGFKREHIRKLTSDDNYRLPSLNLRREIAKDRLNGRRPFCIVANAGTTNTGAVDPLEELADLCNEEDLWLHIDGAYGAASILSDKGRSLLKGIERADSLTIDPHKWLFQPYEIGCVLVRDGDQLRETFQILPEYLEDVYKVREFNPCDYGIQLTRSFRALKLWMSIKIFGLKAFRKAVTRGISLAEIAEKILRESSKWEIVTPAQLGIVTFSYVPESGLSEKADLINRRIVEKSIEDGFAMISSTVLRGRTVLRLCTINPRTTEEDIGKTIERLEDIGREIEEELKSKNE
ncbi:decarboxylase, partial [Candidatus Geothermarchaeota archaeon]